MALYEIGNDNSDLDGAVITVLGNDVEVTLPPHFAISQEYDTERWELARFIYRKNQPGVAPEDVQLVRLDENANPVEYSIDPNLRSKGYAVQTAHLLRAQVEERFAQGLTEVDLESVVLDFMD